MLDRLSALEASGCEAGVGQVAAQTNGPLLLGACLRVQPSDGTTGNSDQFATQAASRPKRDHCSFQLEPGGRRVLGAGLTPHYGTQGSPGPSSPRGRGGEAGMLGEGGGSLKKSEISEI